MEPKLPTPERGPNQYAPNYEQNPGYAQPEQMPERTGEYRGERVEQRSEAAPAAANAAPVFPVTTAPAPPQPSVQQPAPAVVHDDDTPINANDDDIIEKEWVDKAKKIVSSTKDDPYRREQEISKLQADYLYKRYGKELGAGD